MKPLRSLLIAAIALAGIAASSPAHAAYGYVRGRLLFYQNQGNFCPSWRDCSGANYHQWQFNAYNPVAQTKVYVRNASNKIIGQGATDTNGYFTMAWYDWTAPSGARITWHAEHKDGRFVFQNPSGGQPWMQSSSTFTLTNYTAASNPQQIGSFYWGGRGSAHFTANAYDGAWRTWYYSLRYSGRMIAYFNNLTIRAFSSDGGCGTSCANAGTNTVQLDVGAAFAPQARVMHEMGHIASSRSHRGQNYAVTTNYCYPSSTPGACGWQLDTAEWAGSAFEEAMATFIGDRAIYWSWAKQPHTCIASAVACPTGSFNTETKPLPNMCFTNENRWPITIVRFLVDVYDTNADYATETMSRRFYTFFDALDSYAPGTGNRQRDEAWCSGSNCDYDGHSTYDFVQNYQSKYGVSPILQWLGNCAPPAVE